MALGDRNMTVAAIPQWLRMRASIRVCESVCVGECVYAKRAAGGAASAWFVGGGVGWFWVMA